MGGTCGCAVGCSPVVMGAGGIWCWCAWLSVALIVATAGPGCACKPGPWATVMFSGKCRGAWCWCG